MGTNKLIAKLENFLDLSKKKQREKQEKLRKIVANLEEKHASIKHQIAEESETNQTSERFYELESKLKVVNKMLKKARKHLIEGKPDEED